MAHYSECGLHHYKCKTSPPNTPFTFLLSFQRPLKKSTLTQTAYFFLFSVKSFLLFHNAQVYLHTSPLCHIGGISSAHAIILVGGCHVFLPKFRALDAFDAIKEHQVTAMIAVPAMLKDLTSLLLSRYLV